MATPEPGTTRYLCPLSCGWHHDRPPARMSALAGISPAADAATLGEAVASIVKQAALQEVEATEAAIREHVGTHGIRTVEELRAAVQSDPGSST